VTRATVEQERSCRAGEFSLSSFPFTRCA
jgi:hypothetical protein